MIVEEFEIPNGMSFSVHYNRHKEFYSSIKDYCTEHLVCLEIDQEIISRLIKADCIWEVRVYPRTPISFLYGIGSTLKEALIMLFEQLEESS